MQVYSKCSNYASDTCPCELAENGHCIECSMCRGEELCSCTDTVSFCVYQELINNGGKAKEQRRSRQCKVTTFKRYDDGLRFIRVQAPDDTDMSEFQKLGAYVFIRTKENSFFDMPISVVYEEQQTDTIGLLLQIQGVKTESFRELEVGDSIMMRGPYFNGLQGRKDVAGLHNGKAAVFCRGIGFLPSISVIQTLRNNGNEVSVYLDKGHFSPHLLKVFEQLFEINIREVGICNENGELTDEVQDVLSEHLKTGIDLIHLGLSDYLIKSFSEFPGKSERMPAVSFINNTQMCCGEGICGACTRNLDSGRTVHLCKEQLDINDLKKMMKVVV